MIDSRRPRAPAPETRAPDASCVTRVLARERQRGAPEHAARVRRAEGLSVRRQAYYDVLHEDPRFEQDLRALFVAVFPEFRKPLTPAQRERAIRKSDARGASAAEWRRFARPKSRPKGRGAKTSTRAVRHVPTPDEEHEARVLGAFIAHWHLPGPWSAELYAALDLARYTGGPPKLRAVHGYFGLQPRIRPKSLPERVRQIRSSGQTPEQQERSIHRLLEQHERQQAALREGFVYRPDLSPERVADRVLQPSREARAELIEQMRAQHVRPLVGARLRDRRANRRMALRLYRAAVLDPKTWTYERIAAAERREGHGDCTWKDVSASVHDLAKALGVELPRRKSPGRPRQT